MSFSDAPGPSPSPQNSQKIATLAPTIPHKSSKRNLRNATNSQNAKHGSSISPPKRSADGLVRPLPKSRSAPFNYMGRGTRRVAESLSSSLLGTTGRLKGDSPIRKGGSSGVDGIGLSATSVLATSKVLSGGVADPAESTGPLGTSRSRMKNIFVKFTGVLTDHFGPKGLRKRDRCNDVAESQPVDSEMSTEPIIHGPSLGVSSLTHRTLPDVSNTRLDLSQGIDKTQHQNTRSLTGRPKASLSRAGKRLTIVDEADHQSGQSTEDDPFSESSRGQNSTDFEARLQSKQGSRDDFTPTDPFEAERILETSVDAILTTPPFGCSTPRRRLSRCVASPTKGTRDRADNASALTSLSPIKTLRRRKAHTIRESPAKENIAPKTGQSGCGRTDKAASGRQAVGSSDSTRLSSYPPGSTIRHVPRSMGRLKDIPALPAAAAEGGRRQPLTRKKHPSPSKGQLEIFGQFMEKNLAIGIFKDSDELGMSFNSQQGNPSTLSPRDTNRLMRGSAVSNVDLRKDYAAHGSRTGPSKPRSRIPQPVKPLSRSRTDTAIARDFYPANKGDSAMDELQWDSTTYKLDQRCNNCGSMNQVV